MISQPKFRRKAITRILNGEKKQDDWDVRTYPSNTTFVKRIAESSPWQDVCDKDYIMAFDVEAAASEARRCRLIAQQLHPVERLQPAAPPPASAAN